MNKKKIGQELRHQTDVFFAEREKQTDGVSYMDICSITDWIEKRFTELDCEMPQLLSGAILTARASLDPSKLRALGQLKKGLGLLLTTAGGLSVAFGFMVSLGVGASLWTVFISFFSGGSIPVGGPIAIAAGVAAIAAGVYVCISMTPKSTIVAKTHDLLISAIREWEKTEEELQADDSAAVQKLKSLSEEQDEGAPTEE